LSVLTLQAQDITNKLGGNTATETYDVTDSGDNLLFRVQGDGNTLIGMSSPMAQLSVDSGTEDIAIYGQSIFDYAIRGFAHRTTGTNYGGFFESAGLTGRGVYGVANNSGNGINFGGYFVSNSSEGKGVYGLANNAGDWNNYGGYFQANGIKGIGVYGRAGNTLGIGVYGSSPYLAGYFSGDVQITGGLLLQEEFKDKDGDAGTAGQILSSTATGTNWIDASSSGTDSDWTISGSDMYSAVSGNVGIGNGAFTPKSKLHVDGTITVDTKIQAENTSGLQLATDEGTTRLLITDSGDISIGTTTSGNPLRVESTDNSQPTIYAKQGGTHYSFYGESAGIAIVGKSTDYQGIQGSSMSDIGVAGYSESSNGVKGISTSGDGVFGQADGAGDGVSGFSQSGNGVYGRSVSGVGVYGDGDTYGGYFISSGSTAIYAEGTAYAGYFNGNLSLEGAFEDKDGDVGTSGQILSSTATGTNWIDASSSGSDSDWTISGNNMHSTVSGNVSIGTTSYNNKLTVESDGTTAIYGNQSSSTGSTYGVYGNTNAATGAGVKGTAGPTGANFGGHFSAPAMDGTGVYGQGNKYGGYFNSTAMPAGIGLYSEGTTYAGQFVGPVFANGSFQLTGAFSDKDGDVGTSGQILSSTATGTNWIDTPSETDVTVITMQTSTLSAGERALNTFPGGTTFGNTIVITIPTAASSSGKTIEVFIGRADVDPGIQFSQAVTLVGNNTAYSGNEFFQLADQYEGIITLASDGTIWRGFGMHYGGAVNPCFIAGTKITMADGSVKNIEDINVDEVVASYNFESNQIVFKKVLKTFANLPSRGLVEIAFSDGTINTNTLDHRYFVVGKGWSAVQPKSENDSVHAEKLLVGDMCFLQIDDDLKPVKVVKITKKPNLKKKTFNFTVEGTECYFANGFLVHNRY